MSRDSFYEALNDFCSTFVHALVAWNRAEDAARRILEALAEGGLGTMAAVAHLGSRGLDDAILTVADLYDDPEKPELQLLAGHLQHFVDGLGLLRAYRNFYVHSLHSVGQRNQKDAPIVGVLYATEAKGRYAWVQQDVTDAELLEFRGYCEMLQRYGRSISANLQKNNPLLPPPQKQLLSSLEKPLWPEQLKKNRNYLVKR